MPSPNGRDDRDRDARPAQRSLREDLSRLGERLASTQRGAERALHGAVKRDPLLAAAGAAGLGFVLGGGLTPRNRALLLGAGSRLASHWLGRSVLSRDGADGSHV